MPRVLIGSIAEIRVSISRAALLVKVTARTPFGLTFPVWMSQAIRVVSTRVLPEPAPARISAAWSGRVTAASCSGLRFSSRFSMRAFANARFYRTLLERAVLGRLHCDCVVVPREARPTFQIVRHELCVLPRLEIRQPHAVDALLTGFGRNDLGGVSGFSQLIVYFQGVVVLVRGDRDLPFAAAPGHAPARLRLGFRRPFPEPVRRHRCDRPRQLPFESIKGQRPVHGKRPFAGRRNLDRARDQAHDLAVGGGFAPEIRAADSGRYGLDRDVHLASAAEFFQRLGRKPERTFGDSHGRLEDLVFAHARAVEEEQALLAELQRAAVGGPQDDARQRPGPDLIATAELHARSERSARAAAQDRGGQLHRFDYRKRGGSRRFGYGLRHYRAGRTQRKHRERRSDRESHPHDCLNSIPDRPARL